MADRCAVMASLIQKTKWPRSEAGATLGWSSGDSDCPLMGGGRCLEQGSFMVMSVSSRAGWLERRQPVM
jgi:hypothetical protein